MTHPYDPADPELLQAIRPSAIKMAQAEGTFIYLLHGEVGHLLRHLPDGGRGFCERTCRTVLWAILTEQPPEAAIEGLNWLGLMNQGDGFPASEYVTVAHALIRVARDMTGQDWTGPMGSAWVQFFMWIQPHLHDGAAAWAAQWEASRTQAGTARQAAPHSAAGQAPPQSFTDVDVSALAALLYDEDDHDDGPSGAGHGQIMMDMTGRHHDEYPRGS